jgi:hypothetical protein
MDPPGPSLGVNPSAVASSGVINVAFIQHILTRQCHNIKDLWCEARFELRVMMPPFSLATGGLKVDPEKLCYGGMT